MQPRRYEEIAVSRQAAYRVLFGYYDMNTKITLKSTSISGQAHLGTGLLC